MRLIGRTFLLLVVITIGQPATGTEQPRMVADIFPGDDSSIGLFPEEIMSIGDSVFFSGRRSDLGRELWVISAI